MQLSILGRKIDKGGRGKPSGQGKRGAGGKPACADKYITREKRIYNHCGDDSGEDPPVLIPNTEVKLSCAEST